MRRRMKFIANRVIKRRDRSTYTSESTQVAGEDEMCVELFCVARVCRKLRSSGKSFQYHLSGSEEEDPHPCQPVAWGFRF
jgi:hypothetical protein